MKQATPTEKTIKIRAEVDKGTHRALKQEQSRRELQSDSGERPHMTVVVALILSEWAANQPAVAG